MSTLTRDDIPELERWMKMPEREDLDLIDDPFRKCEVDETLYYEDYGESCDVCDIWICNNCWPEHTKETGHTKA